jgi:hypothetical protein
MNTTRPYHPNAKALASLPVCALARRPWSMVASTSKLAKIEGIFGGCESRARGGQDPRGALPT